MQPTRLLASAMIIWVLAGCNLSDPYPVDLGLPMCAPPDVHVLAAGKSSRLKPGTTPDLKVPGSAKITIRASGDCADTVRLLDPAGGRVKSFTATSPVTRLWVFWVPCKTKPGQPSVSCPLSEFGRIQVRVA